MPAPTVRPGQRERYDERQQEVLDTCAAVFARRGFHATTIGDLIEATNLTRGGLYHYIEGKEQALLAVVDELLDPLLARARPIVESDASAEERLRALVREWLRHVEAHRAHMLVFQQERHTLAESGRWEQIRGPRDEFEGLLRRVLEEGVAAGDFATEDPALVMRGILGMVNHSPQWFDPGGRLSADEVADGFCDVLLGGLRA